LALVSVTASERGSSGPLAFVGSIPIASGAQLLISGAQAVVLDATDDDATISGYALPGGRRRWSAPVSVADTGATMFVIGPAVVLDELRPTPMERGQNLDEGFDRTTGRRLWAYPSDRIWPTSAGLLIAVETSSARHGAAPDGPPPADQPRSESIGLIDPANGQIRWSRPMADGCEVTPASATGALPIRSLIEMCPDTQELIGIDLTTGTVMARRQVDLAGVTSPYVVTIRPELLFEGSVTVVAVQDGANIVLSTFRTSDFTPLWSGYPVGAAVQVTGCGPNLCIDDGSGTEAVVDPLTGAKVAGAPSGPNRGCCNAAVSFFAKFGLNEIVVVPPGQTPLAESYPVTIDFEPTAEAGQAVPARDWTSGANPDLWIAEQVTNGRTVSVRPLGVLHGVGEACVAVQGDSLHRYLACTTAVDRLSMWLLG
jgi:hypothetical protein